MKMDEENMVQDGIASSHPESLSLNLTVRHGGHGPRRSLGGDRSDARDSLPAHHLPILSRAHWKGRSQRGSGTSGRSLFRPLSLRGSAFHPLWS